LRYAKIIKSDYLEPLPIIEEADDTDNGVSKDEIDGKHEQKQDMVINQNNEIVVPIPQSIVKKQIICYEEVDDSEYGAWYYNSLKNFETEEAREHSLRRRGNFYKMKRNTGPIPAF
jgi:hypothetical protein